MLKIHDCSINPFAPKHRNESFGPKENDIMSDLKKYSSELGISFVRDFRDADKIITNTTYTTEIVRYAAEENIPLIKRMDGVFWRSDLVYRNIKLNEAAIQSDAVIFISKFSYDSFHSLYENSTLEKEYLVLNNSDDEFFKPTKRKKKIKIWGAAASNWNRKEKRPDELIMFADIVAENDEKIILIGHSNIKHPNIISVGYFSDYKNIAETISMTDAWVNFSYMDAAPKTVIQAMKCGKPVLFADSGGLSELVRNFGVAIKDNKVIKFSDENFHLNMNEVNKSYNYFKEKYNNNEFFYDNKKYIDTLMEYASIIKITECVF